MSLLAFFFLSLCITCALLGLSVELAEAWATLAKAGAVLFGSLFYRLTDCWKADQI